MGLVTSDPEASREAARGMKDDRNAAARRRRERTHRERDAELVRLRAALERADAVRSTLAHEVVQLRTLLQRVLPADPMVLEWRTGDTNRTMCLWCRRYAGHRLDCAWALAWRELDALHRRP